MRGAVAVATVTLFLVSGFRMTVMTVWRFPAFRHCAHGDKPRGGLTLELDFYA